MKTNKYEYEAGEYKVKGFFKIYQAVDGSIILCMNNRFTRLKKTQLNDLCLDLYILDDFNHDKFTEYYNKEDGK